MKILLIGQGIAGTLLAWSLGYAFIVMDTYERRYISWGQTVAMAIISALLWPLILIRRPRFFKRPTETYEWDPARSRFDRERDRLLKDLKRCTNRVRFEAHHNGKMIGEFEFPSDAISAYLAHRTDKDGYGNINDLPESVKYIIRVGAINLEGDGIVVQQAEGKLANSDMPSWLLIKNSTAAKIASGEDQ